MRTFAGLPSFILPLPLVLPLVVVLGCPAADGDENGTGGTSESSESSTATSNMGGTGTGTGSESDSGMDSESGSESETGPACTDEPCFSTLTLVFSHSLPLLDGPHRFLIDTPNEQEILCGVEASLEGAKSCFGFAFSDLSWTADEVRVVLTGPFYDTLNNPEALPFESVHLRVERGMDQIFEADVPIEPGEPEQPDPCGPVCWPATGSADVTE